MKCADTAEAVHVSCAALAGFTVGFEIQTVGANIIAQKRVFVDLELKGKARKDGVIVTFRGETGILTPIVARKPRRLHGLCDTDSSGQVRVHRRYP